MDKVEIKGYYEFYCRREEEIERILRILEKDRDEVRRCKESYKLALK